MQAKQAQGAQAAADQRAQEQFRAANKGFPP